MNSPHASLTDKLDTRAVVSTMGKWHHFELAHRLYQLDWLDRLYTGYPRRKVDYVPHALVSSFPFFTTAEMMATRVGWHHFARLLNWPSHDWFDRWVAANLKPCDIFVANHGNGSCSFRKARVYGAKIVCDSGQAHPEFIRNTLSEEYAKWGVEYHDYDKKSLEKRLEELEEADLITVPSTFNVRTFVGYGIAPSKLARIPYGVDLSVFHPIPKEDNIFRVLFVGAAGIRKGLPYLLEAFANLKLPNFELVIVGGFAPDAKPILDYYAARTSFRYLGFVPRTELYKVYSQGSVLVLPSLIEGLAYVQAQAMACGLPIVATTNTGAEDLFSDGVEGYIIPIRDPVALREKVLFLYENPSERARMGIAAQERVQALGGWEQYGHDIETVYSKLLGWKQNTLVKLT